MRLENRLLIIFFLYFLIHSDLAFSEAESDKHVFSTWDSFEVDKCASIWLIKRFVDKKARFVFLPKEDFTPKGVPFDVPTADLRRYHNLSTFQSILKKYKLKDPAMVEIGKRIYDIEVNYWGKKMFEDSYEIDLNFKKIINEYKDAETVIEKSLDYFDRLYRKYKPENRVKKKRY